MSRLQKAAVQSSTILDRVNQRRRLVCEAFNIEYLEIEVNGEGQKRCERVFQRCCASAWCAVLARYACVMYPL
jgi:hypothetical protein